MSIRVLNFVRRFTLIFLCPLLLLQLAGGVPPLSREYVVLLDEAPVVTQYPGRIEKTRALAEPYRQHLKQTQANLRATLEAANIKVIGGVQHLVNAMFIKATPEQAETVKGMTGVRAVVASRRYYLKDQLTLSNVQGAWAAAKIGGQGNAGAGLKIAIVDTGIDQTHPSFQDSTLKAPAGFPVCDVPSNCAYTSNKVIVARSYVSALTAGSNPSDPAADSRPDDLSAQDLDGHGTAVSSVAAGEPGTADGATLSGVAPKAFLGNYKIYGSPEVNDYSSDAGIMSALDDAVTDGMDIVNLSSGGPAFGGPLDSGATCGLPTGEPCDPAAYAIEQAINLGEVLVVVAAGNEGSTGYRANQPNSTLPTFGTIASPAYAPSALAAGGIENDVTYVNSVQISGTAVPSNLAKIGAFPSADGPIPTKALTAPIVDVSKVGDADGLLCAAIATGSLMGDIALIQRGTCDFSVKVTFAQTAGAVGVVFINDSSNPTTLSGWGGLSTTQIPAFMISQSDGDALKTFLDSTSGVTATMNPNASQTSSAALGFIPDSVAYFASRGPATGTNGLKPDVSAVATDFLLAAEDVDPYGDLYNASRYATADGTSFSTPMLSGAAALVKQANPTLTPLQLKSAVVNTANLTGLLNQAGTAPASITEVGAGILQAQNAVLATVQIVPSSVSFGLLNGSLPGVQSLTVSNTGTTAVTLSATVAQPALAGTTQVLVNNLTSTTLSVPGGGSVGLDVTLSGSVPSAGRYEGLITLMGGPVPLHIPYMFLVANNTAYDVIPLYGQDFDGPINQQLPSGEGPLAIRVIDQNGAPVENAGVNWTPTIGGGSVVPGGDNTSTTTDVNGIAFATVTLGSTVGAQEFTATVAGLTVPFDGNGRIQPAINPGGVVDAASFTAGRAVAPGSIISVFGTGLGDAIGSALTIPLPYGIVTSSASVAFSFDVPTANISVPGRFYYASPGQLNVQVPWELAGQTSAIVKVIVNFTYSAEYTLALATYSPGFFANSVNGQLIAAALTSTNQVVGASNPVSRGGTVELFMNGLGPVQTPPASGADVTTADSTTAVPTITIGGQAATVSYSGLAPYFVGLYQVNAVVPSGIGTGLQPMTCSIGGVSCQQVMLPVQ
jgi:uncharacterized protein (TIGR03437 family)